MKRFLLRVCMLLTLAGNAQLTFSERNVDLGDVPAAKTISGNIVITNSGTARIFLLRADADPGVTVFTSKKALLPGDTALLSIGFTPGKAGDFKKKISLVTSDQAGPSVLTISGHLGRITGNDAMACYYFGKAPQRTVATKDPPVADPPPVTPQRGDTVFSHRRPKSAPPAPVRKQPVTAKTEDLPRDLYRPNNLLFLVDVSGSMRDSTKLGYMKLTLHHLIDAIRDIDSVSFITYADTVRVLSEARSGADKSGLHGIVDGLKAGGVTHGRKAMLLGQKLLQKHYVRDGNNQMLIATDGLFYFDKKDEAAWFARQGNEPVVVSTIAFGHDAKAFHSLRSIARKGNGSFIRIESRWDTQRLLMEEIRKRSANNR